MRARGRALQQIFTVTNGCSSNAVIRQVSACYIICFTWPSAHVASDVTGLAFVRTLFV